MEIEGRENKQKCSQKLTFLMKANDYTVVTTFHAWLHFKHKSARLWMWKH